MSRNGAFAEGHGMNIGPDPVWPRMVQATHPKSGRVVGKLGWEKANPPGWEGRPPTVASADVHKRYRRKGIASAMFDHAKSIEPDLQHSHALTDDGKAFVAGHTSKKEKKS